MLRSIQGDYFQRNNFISQPIQNFKDDTKSAYSKKSSYLKQVLKSILTKLLIYFDIINFVDL